MNAPYPASIVYNLEKQLEIYGTLPDLSFCHQTDNQRIYLTFSVVKTLKQIWLLTIIAEWRMSKA